MRVHHTDYAMAKITANRLMAEHGPALPMPQVAAVSRTALREDTPPSFGKTRCAYRRDAESVSPNVAMFGHGLRPYRSCGGGQGNPAGYSCVVNATQR